MMYEVRWSREALQDLRALERLIADRITRKMEWYCQQTKPLRHAEPLTGTYTGVYRFRVGAYRVLFEVDPRGHLHVLLVLRVKHR